MQQIFQEKQKRFAKGIVILIFAALAILILVVAINVVTTHIDERGNIKDDDECLTEDAKDLMKKSGYKVPSAARCKKKE